MGKTYTDNQIKWLKDHFEAEIVAVRQAVDKVEGTNTRAIDKVESTNTKAVDKVESNYKDYREQQNEWRQQIKDQTSTFVTRRELTGAVVAIVTMVLAAVAIVVTYIK